MNLRIFKNYLCFTFMLWSSLLNGQDSTRVSEEEIQSQALFLESFKQRLIGKPQAGVEGFEALVRKNPNEPAIYYELSRDYFLNKEYDKALDNIEKAILRDDANIWYKFFKAEILEKNLQPAAAAEIYEKLVIHYPRVKEYWVKLGRLYYNANEKDTYLNTLDRMEKTFGPQSDILRQKFDAYLELGENDLAIETIQRALSSNPDNIFFLNSLASVYMKVGRQDEAKTYYQKVLALDPNDLRANSGIAQSYKNSHNNKSYLNSIQALILNPALPIEGKLTELIPYLQQYIEGKDTSLAAPLLDIGDKLQQTHPKDAKTFAFAGDIYFHTGNYNQALNAYEKAINLNKSIFSVMDQKMLILFYLKRFTDLNAFADEVLEIYPNQLSLYFYKGFALLRMGQPKEASEILNQATLMFGKKHNQAVSIQTLLAVCYTALQNQTEAESNLSKALSLVDLGPEQQNNFASIAADFGIWYPQANKAIDKALKSEPDNPFYLKTKAQLTFNNKEFSKALEWINLSLKHQGEKYPYIVELAGDIFFQNHDQAKALTYWQKAKSMGVQSVNLDRKISSKSFVH